MAYTKTNTGDVRWKYVSSPRVAVAATEEFTAVDPTLPRCFVGVKLYTDVAAGTQVVGTAGSFAVSVKTENTGQWETIGTIDATAPATLNFSGNVTDVKVVPTSVSGNSATHYEVVFTANAR